MLASLCQNKRRSHVSMVDALCKSLAWFFPLIDAFNVKSLERIIFRKFPGICPYCRASPHNAVDCKATTGITEGMLDHQRVTEIYREKLANLPAGLNQWQEMFQSIYPRGNVTNISHSALGLAEELGELAEAIRVFDRHPRYFVGEVADVFSYIMGIANQHVINQRIYSDPAFTLNLENEYLLRYPGLCIECGYTVCRCPHIPDATIGRMAKEISIESIGELFYLERDFEEIETTSRTYCSLALDAIGGYRSLLSRFPLDRGQANYQMAKIASKLADEVEHEFPDLASDLRVNALQLRNAETEAGAKHHSEHAFTIIDKLNQLFSQPAAAATISENAEIKRDLTRLAHPEDSKRILVVMPLPDGEVHIRTDREYKTISDALRLSGLKKYFLEPIPASTLDDFRRSVLDADVAIVHLSGHGTWQGMKFEDAKGNVETVEWHKILAYLDSKPSIECVILNSCNSAPQELTDSGRIATIYMEEAITDVAAIEFSRGFYDALGRGASYRQSFDEGVNTVNLKGRSISAHFDGA